MVKHTQPPKWSNTLRQFAGNLSTTCLSVFHYFLGLALKGLTKWPGTNLPNRVKWGFSSAIFKFLFVEGRHGAGLCLHSSTQFLDFPKVSYFLKILRFFFLVFFEHNQHRKYVKMIITE